MELTKKQTKALDYLEDNKTKEIGFGGGAGGGKSALGCYWQIKNRLRYPGSRGLIGRSKLKTLKETTLVTFFQIAKMQGLSNKDYNYNQQKSTIEFFNGSSILLKDLFLYPSDPEFDELGSLEITDAFIDESAQVVKKGYTVLKSRIRYKLDEFNLIPKILWTSNPSKNWNYTDFYLLWEKGELSNDKAFIQSLVTDNPHISPHYIENLKSLDENSKQRLLLGNWHYDNDPTKLISFDKILDLWSNYVDEDGVYISADIARFGSDRAVIIVWKGMRVVKILSFEKSGINTIIDTIEELRQDYSVPKSNVICDEDGVGGGVVDVGGYVGFVNNSTPLEEDGIKPNYQNLKTQCYYYLAKMINNGKVSIGCEDFKDVIVQELEQVRQYKMDDDGKLRIIPKNKLKEMLGRSPDFADALMMRMYFVLKVMPNFFTF